MANTTQTRSGTLSHIRVLDLSRVFAGPWAGQMLADLGAEVIKVERPKTGDDSRRLGPPFLRDDQGNETDVSGFYLSANRNKQSITIDISLPEGQQLIRELAMKCDVLIENYKVGDLARYGLDYESLKDANPRLVYCSITAFGQTGPLRKLPGYDSIFQGMGGIMAVTGHPDEHPGGGPQKVGIIVSDLMAGMYASVAILAAIEHRNSVSGCGQYIDLALLDTQIAALSHAGVGYLVSGDVPQRRGTVAPTGSPSQMFMCADGPIMLVVGNDPQFARLCAVMGVPELATDPRFVNNRLRISNREALNAILMPIFRSRDKREWISAIGEAGVPCGPVNELNEVFAEQQVQAREMVMHMSHPLRQNMPLIANPIRFSQTPVQHRMPPPALGAHTVNVLRELLGYEDSTLTRLREQEVI